MSELQTPIKGSWEALLVEAERLAHSLDDAAVAPYEKIVKRLERLPLAHRMASDGYLQKLWLQAAAGLVRMYAMSGREDEAVKLADLILMHELGDEMVEDWEQVILDTLVQGGRGGEAVERAQSLVEALMDGESWGVYFRTLFRLRRFEELSEALDKLHASYGELREEGTPPDDLDLLHVLEYETRADLAAFQGDWGAARQWHDKAVRRDSLWEEVVSNIYVRMVQAGAYAEALPLIRRDPKYALRGRLWHGIVLRRTGKEEQARELWEAVIEEGPTLLREEGNELQVEDYVLAHYYTGDAEGVGLGVVLDGLAAAPEPDYFLFALAGLGWGVRSHAENAMVNFRLASLAVRSVSKGPLLPYSLWYHCAELLSPALLEQARPLFDADFLPAHAPARSSTAAGV